MRNWIFPLLLSAAAAPRPPPELEQLKPFLVSARCSGEVEESPFAAAHKTAGSMAGSRDRSGFWILIHYQEKGSSSDERWGYDPGAKKFVALLSDSMGGYGMGSSPGWEADDLIWTGDVYMNGQKMPYRQTFTLQKDGSISEQWEMQMDGQWKKLTSGACKKAK
ncbi:MAG TPA: DUF1579 family protein [Myxococcales bacterium]|nr:DUF1579 family protein [Myxococcales bacterium]